MKNNKVHLITYPDSLGNNLDDLNKVLDKYFQDTFYGIHILPPYPSSGDRGFAPIDYFSIDEVFGNWDDIKKLGRKYNIMLDLMVNHISRLSAQFKDYQQYGDRSQYSDFFIKVLDFWGNTPNNDDLNKIFLRRPLPYSNYNIDGEYIDIWTTFGKENHSEQVDININSLSVRQFFRDILKNFARYNVSAVRLDALAYVVKKKDTSCFFVEPNIYEFTDWMIDTASDFNLELLPEVHSEFKYQKKLSDRGYWIYDFILPYTVLDAIINQKSDYIIDYLNNRPSKQITMLDCHDGIPIIPDMNGYFDIARARNVVAQCKKNSGNFSRIMADEHKINGFDVHQINITYYEALSQNDDAYFLARAIQLFTPGIPQVYYVGLLAGLNDHDFAESTGDGRYVNRHNFTIDEIQSALEMDIVKRQTALIHLRNQHKAFDGEFVCKDLGNESFKICYTKDDSYARLYVDLKASKAKIVYTNLDNKEIVF